MREINVITTKKHSLWSHLDFKTEFKNRNKTDLQVIEGISFCDRFKYSTQKKKRCQECLDWIQNLGLKWAFWADSLKFFIVFNPQTTCHKIPSNWVQSE